jgi:competence protein ComEC
MELTQLFFGRILLCFTLGIFIGYYIPLGQEYLPIITSSVIILFLAYLLTHFISTHLKTYTPRYLRGILAYILVVILGINLYHLRSTNFEPNHFSKTEFTTFKASLTEEMKQGANSSKGIFEIEQIQTKTGWQKANGKVIVYAKDKTQFPIGTTLTIKKQPQKIKPPLNPTQFDYAAYLNKKYITHSIFIQQNDIVHINKAEGYGISFATEPVQKKLKELFRQYIPSDASRALVQGLLLGDKSDMDQEINMKYSQVGLAHILAVSGFHTALLYQVLFYAFIFIKNIRGGKYLHIVLVLSGLWYYSLLTGLSPSVIRAATMLTLLIFTNLLKRQPYSMHILSLTGFVILLFSPNTIFDLGFQLSFCAVLGIFTLNKTLKNIYKTEHKIIKPIWETTCISISAQIFTIPIILYYFHQFPLYFIASNLFTLLPVIGIIYLSLLLIAFSWLPFIADLLGILIFRVAQLMDWIVTVISTFPTFTDHIYIHSIQAVLVMLCILCFSYGIVKKKTNWLYSSYILIIVFWGIQQSSHMLATKQKSIAIFHINNHSVITLLNGKNAWIYTDIPNPENNIQIRHACRDYLSNNRVSKIHYQTLTGNTVIKAWGKKINISDGKKELPLADFHILHRCKKETELKQQNLTKIIVDGSNRILLDKNLICYRTDQSGAFIEHF